MCVTCLGGDPITGLVAVIRRALARDFFGYYKKLQGIIYRLKPQQPITAAIIADMMAALHIHANTKAVTFLHRRVINNMRFVQFLILLPTFPLLAHTHTHIHVTIH